MKLPESNFMPPAVVSGAELREFFHSAGLFFVSQYRVDPAIDYRVYGMLDTIAYEQKSAWLQTVKVSGIRRSVLMIDKDRLFCVCFSPVDAETEKLAIPDFRTQEEKKQDQKAADRKLILQAREEKKLQKQIENNEKKVWGRSRFSKAKIWGMLSDHPQCAEDFVSSLGISYATVQSILGKMLDMGMVNRILQGDRKRYYTKIIERG